MLCYHQNVERLKHVPIIKTLESMLLFFLSPVGVLLRENNQAFCLHLHQAPCRLRLIIRTFFFLLLLLVFLVSFQKGNFI